ncbi:MAG: DUF1064 domain-containing protein [Hyphomicrobiaceae bacterium]|nr:MAG: DUF1064 domain-containing protein [Hyphomicrobiaceae bacterium]
MRRLFKRADGSKYGKRHKPGVMNQTETAYSEILHARQLAGEVLLWAFESVTFKLADRCTYTPDFAVWLADGTMEFVDCKGGGPMDDKSRVKVKVAAEKFPQFVFVIEKRLSKKDGGGWKREEF